MTDPETGCQSSCDLLVTVNAPPECFVEGENLVALSENKLARLRLQKMGFVFQFAGPLNFFLGLIQVFINLCQAFLQTFFIVYGGLVNVFILRFLGDQVH